MMRDGKIGEFTVEVNLFNRKLKISSFSIIVFTFFLLVSVVSLHVVREKILNNSHIMGQAVAARFAIKETSKIKSQEMLLRSVAQSMGHMLTLKDNWTDAEIERALRHFTDYMENNAEVARFDMCAVIDGRPIGKNLSDNIDVKNLRWYTAALENKGEVAYTNLYRYGDNAEFVLTMAIQMGNENHVLAMNLYPERLSSVLSDNELPEHSYYYLCDPNGNIMFTINDRELSIEDQQPYVDQILNELNSSTINEHISSITDLEGNKRGVYYAVSDKGWISIVTIPYDYLLGDYENLLHWVILTVGIFLLLTIVWGLREYTLNRRVENINEVIRVMSKSFLAVFRVNFQKGQYYVLKADDLGFPENSSGSYEDLLSQLVKHVEPEAADEFAESFSLGNIQKLVEKRIFDFGGEFRQKLGQDYKWVNVRLVRDIEILNDNEAIFFLREVDAEKLKELEHLQVTERALAVAQENAKSRNMFFSAMSHDMRVPLNGIIGMAELASLHKDDKDLVANYISKIKSSGKQLLTLINDILEMARLDNGKVEHLQETFDISAIVREISDMFKVQAEMDQKYFEEQIKIEKEMVSGDLQSLHQILNNILSNALKYTKTNDRISFMVRREVVYDRNCARYTFIIKDTGCGMSEKFLAKIYDPFERDSRFGVPKVIGTGLGMTIVKSLVERLDGEIHITSRINGGTCVIISLPFNVVKNVETIATDLEVPELTDFAGSRVLVAEDNDINMEIVSELLGMNGINVIQASNGQEAVDKFMDAPEGSIDMILMDMQMPKLDGCEAAKIIRDSKRNDADTVPILALTGSSDNETVEAAMKAGMNDYMIKPVKMKLMAKMMGEYLHR